MLLKSTKKNQTSRKNRSNRIKSNKKKSIKKKSIKKKSIKKKSVKKKSIKKKSIKKTHGGSKINNIRKIKGGDKDDKVLDEMNDLIDNIANIKTLLKAHSGNQVENTPEFDTINTNIITHVNQLILDAEPLTLEAISSTITSMIVILKEIKNILHKAKPDTTELKQKYSDIEVLFNKLKEKSKPGVPSGSIVPSVSEQVPLQQKPDSLQPMTGDMEMNELIEIINRIIEKLDSRKGGETGEEVPFKNDHNKTYTEIKEYITKLIVRYNDKKLDWKAISSTITSMKNILNKIKDILYFRKLDERLSSLHEHYFNLKNFFNELKEKSASINELIEDAGNNIKQVLQKLRKPLN